MFHLVMACMFFYRHCSRLKIYVSVLMLTIVAQYVKDLIFIGNTYYGSRLEEQYASSIDLLTLPMYAIVLVEACRPLWMNWSRAFCFYIPFVVLMVAFWVHPVPLAYHAMHFAAILCAVFIALWALRELPRFERALKEEYSYAEYINLHWLRGVILLFFCLLMLWVYDSMASGVRYDNLFLFNSLVMWIAACFCFYRQSVVINAVKSYFVEPSEDNAETNLDAAENDLDKAMAHLEAAEADQNAPHAHTQPESVAETVAEPQPVAEQPVEPEPEELKLQQEAAFAERMYLLFEKEHVYLNPRLRLSELAMLLGTNRTYLSQYFNQNCESTFYDFVNDYRIHHAKLLLHSTDDTLETIAMNSGFNSLSTFRRAFVQREGMSPIEFRASNGKIRVSNSQKLE
ncbi:MAG: helix-turn-helix domain-containing protein [Prevotella sp.]|uniref:helix-turn-helix domain-containing protein n=1 Tax=Leyella stercorea TaxID=363265 RepID=UPI0025D4ABB8|nr:helix-turn-helix domain-containing protein [Prevotella sp.]MDD7211069.1 helix-turn-helix domain-containing protein [Leyella stercorea]MCI7650603.1 helix-turn-helix domain-containing protein [Prevotella sp.]MDD7720647.1 helix-turn-helix domain-containing protein [Leyella stercorea]MDY3620128.1 helix-turn-helix domain-containing protein [Prevotella sp.]